MQLLESFGCGFDAVLQLRNWGNNSGVDAVSSVFGAHIFCNLFCNFCGRKSVLGYRINVLCGWERPGCLVAA